MESLDDRPGEPDYTAEAIRTLGLPDSPVIHFAISTVAELLRPLASMSHEDARSTCIDRYRVASGTVLERQPIEWARHQFQSRIGVEVDNTAWETIKRLLRTDWLGQAKASLEARGVDTGPDAQRMASRYGWYPVPRDI